MTEQKTSKEGELLEWQDMLRRGVEDVIANYGEVLETIYFDPFTVSAGEDERTWNDISDQEREWILKELFYKNSFDRQNNIVVGTYSFSAPDDPETTWHGKAVVEVFETKRSKLDNMYLHEIRRPKCPVEYVVAPKGYRL